MSLRLLRASQWHFLFYTRQLTLYAGDDSPRLRYAGRPSLRLRRKEGKKAKLKFQLPLSTEGEERDVERSDDRVSLSLG
jgi:hydroxyacyl-ACP dehydratase HTD2-like protein with hotdog domain